MTNTHSWGGSVTNTSFSGYPGNVVYRDGTPFPTANLAANGNRPLFIHSVSPGPLTNGSAEIAGGRALGINATSGGTFRFQYRNTGGTMSFGRAAGDGGTITDAGDGGTWTGSLPGSLQWSGVPTSAQTPAVADGTASGEAVVTWTAPASDGGSAVTSYDVQWSADGFATVLGTTNSTGLSKTITGLTPGTLYSFRVGARNATANAASTTAQWSSVVALTPRSGGRVKRSGVYVPAEFYVKRGGIYVAAQVFVKRSGAYVSAA